MARYTICIFAESKTVNDLRLSLSPQVFGHSSLLARQWAQSVRYFDQSILGPTKPPARFLERGVSGRHLPVATSNAPTKGELTKRQRQQISPSGHTNSFLSTVAETQKKNKKKYKSSKKNKRKPKKKVKRK